MTQRDIAISYLDCFCNGDLAGLSALLGDELNFSGPFHTFTSASEYLDRLRSDPPEKCSYRLLSVTEAEDAVAVFYEYQKSQQSIQIAQLFRISGQRINEILLIFDGRDMV